LIVIKESPTIEINPSKRILKLPGVLCGGISTGTDKFRSGYGNGDCLFFDFEHMVFAIDYQKALLNQARLRQFPDGKI